MADASGVFASFKSSILFGMEAWKWAAMIVGSGGALLLSSVFGNLLTRIVRRFTKATVATWDDDLLETLTPPGKLLVASAFVSALSNALALPVGIHGALAALLRTVSVITLTWLGLRLVKFIARSIEQRASHGESDPTRLQGLRTQVQVLQRVAFIVVGFLGIALVLMQFDVVRTVGTSLLASAGIAGIVVGLAAQRSISTLLAGIQLSITQPVRIGDVVIVENEWGVIEEMTLTYVVVRIWDQRRLVVPITRFLEAPFQNWTKKETAIMGTVFIPADFTVPFDVMRKELDRLVKSNPLWDGRVCGLQLTEANERFVMLRALVSSADASQNWDLRCEVREGLVKFLQNYEHGRYLPRTRLQPLNGDAAAGVLAA